MMSGYQDFSEFYDRLMADVDYDNLADDLLRLFKRYDGHMPLSLLDIACGSGSLCESLVQRGVDPIGVDASSAMLAKAVEKPVLREKQVLLLQQDMRELDLYGTADGAVCILDSINHLCRSADVARFFSRLRLFVKPGGLFIFDVNTPYKHRQVLGDNAFVFEEEDLVCVWRNRYIPKTKETDMALDFFVQRDDGAYYRVSDTVRERAYSRRTLERLLKQTGWDLLAVLGDGTETEPTADCERWIFVTRNNRTVEEATGMSVKENA